jgi:hypothetical protein
MDDNNHITASFVWTFDDFKARQEALISNSVKLSNKPSRSSLLVYGVLILAIVWMLFNLPKPGPSYTPVPLSLSSIVMYLPLFIVLWAAFSFAQKNNLKKSFLSIPDSNKNINITITSDEIIMKADGLYETRYNWSSISEVQKTSKGFCFFQNPQVGFWIPVRAFQSNNDIETVITMAKGLTPKFSVTST